MYLIKNTLTYRVNTVNDVLELRKELEGIAQGELKDFHYKTKQIKAKGEVIDEYQLVTAIIEFCNEKEPDNFVQVRYE